MLSQKKLGDFFLQFVPHPYRRKVTKVMSKVQKLIKVKDKKDKFSS